MKNAEMGVGTLIIFISLLLVAAVAAGVLIQTAGSLQEKSLSTGQQTRSQISTHAETIEVSATDGRNGNVTNFNQLLKLSPGSDPIKLDQVVLTVNTNDRTATLTYKGPNGVCELTNVNGYNTWNDDNVIVEVDVAVNDYTLAEDLDDDGAHDYMYVYNDTGGNEFLYFNLSTAGLVNVSLQADIGVSNPVSITSSAITNGSETYGYVTLIGTTGRGRINTSVTTFTITPYKDGQGYFCAEYEQQSTNHIAGTLQRGDMIKLCYEAPRAVASDEVIRINFIPKIGTATTTEFATPDVISTERVYLYP